MAGYQNEQARQAELNKPKLIVRVIEARGIKAADFGGTSDPFVELRIKGQTHPLKTKTIKKTLNPFWNEELVLYPTNVDTDVLVVKMYDEDASSNNDLLGEIEIHVSAIVNKPSAEEWKQLMERKGPTSFAPAKGEIKLYTAVAIPGQSQQQHPPQQQQPQQPVHQQPPPVQGGPQGYPPQQQGPPQGYPPQQQGPPQGYPPQQQQVQGYPPQQQGYPPQQQGYPPQQVQGYPPPQQVHMQGYPPQQPPYPVQGGYPPQQQVQGYPPPQQVHMQGYPPQQVQGYPPQQHTTGGIPPGYKLDKKGKLKEIKDKKDKKKKK